MYWIQMQGLCKYIRKASQTNILNVNEVETEKRCQHECYRDWEHIFKLCKVDDIKIDEKFFMAHLNSLVWEATPKMTKSGDLCKYI